MYPSPCNYSLGKKEEMLLLVHVEEWPLNDKASPPTAPQDHSQNQHQVTLNGDFSVLEHPITRHKLLHLSAGATLTVPAHEDFKLSNPFLLDMIIIFTEKSPRVFFKMDQMFTLELTEEGVQMNLLGGKKEVKKIAHDISKDYDGTMHHIIIRMGQFALDRKDAYFNHASMPITDQNAITLYGGVRIAVLRLRRKEQYMHHAMNANYTCKFLGWGILHSFLYHQALFTVLCVASVLPHWGHPYIM